jgi:hypothetical protein
MGNMSKEVWLLDNCCGDFEVYERLEDALATAEHYIRKMQNVSDEEKEETLKELHDNYDEHHGFCVDEIIYCWSIPYYN